LWLAAAWFYSWAPAIYPVRWTSPTAEGYYAELTEAYLHGQLSLARQPDPGLTALADPYDPAKNAPYRVNDLSYFQGRYYLYHGAAPVLMLLAPFRWLTGQHLTDPATTLLFCLGGAVCSLLLLAEIRRQAAPRASGLVLGLCALAVLFGHGYHLVLRSSGPNHVAVAAAYFSLTLAVWAAGRALATAGRTWPWLLLASTAYGLAIASRPNYVFGAAALLVPLWFLWRRDGTRSLRLNLAAVAAPLALIVGAMLVHNHLRFGQPLEFGQRYMLGGWDQRKLDFLGFKNVAINAWYYLVGPANLGSQFPFLTAPSWQAVGVLVQAPFVWLGLSVTALWFGFAAPRPANLLRPLAGLLGLVVLCNLGLLVMLPSGNELAVRTSANARYTFDFLPALVLLTCLGVLGLDHALADRSRLRRVWRINVLILTLLTLVGALSLDFHRFPPECYRSLAQILNRPGQLAQSWLGETYGPVKLEVVFPVGKPHHYEPLVATGVPGAGDLLYVFYDSPETIRFGLIGAAMRGPLSPPIPVTYGQPHQVEVRMGSLYPAGGHPALSTLSDAEVGRLKRTLRIDLDGRTVFEAPAHFIESKSRHVQVGATTHLLAYSKPEFSGQILASSRLPIAPLASAQAEGPAYGALRLVVRFPEDKTGVTEPLVVSGLHQAGDFLYVHYESNWQISLGLDHWGHPGLRSPLLPVDYSVNHVVEIQMGALFPPAGHVLLSSLSPAEVARLKRRVRVVLDGEVVIDAEQATFDASPYDVSIGRNPIGGSSCVYGFSGEIKSATRLPVPDAAVR
ncbi:unnamed protein product, partial [Phaeothamnion confervicola]